MPTSILTGFYYFKTCLYLASKAKYICAACWSLIRPGEQQVCNSTGGRNGREVKDGAAYKTDRRLSRSCSLQPLLQHSGNPFLSRPDAKTTVSSPQFFIHKLKYPCCV